MSDWVAHHVRGMALFKKGDIGAAAVLFSDALGCRLPAAAADYFRTSLALCRLRKKDYVHALAALNEVTLPSMTLPANVIKVHVFGEAGRTEECIRTLRMVRGTAPQLTREIAQEFHHRYVVRKPARRSDEWVTETEVRLLLAA